jgi:vacuolar protein sorting-associated protein 41
VSCALHAYHALLTDNPRLRMDCIISGLSLYTPTLLLVLAYITPDPEKVKETPTPKGHKSKGSTASTSSEPSGGIRRHLNALAPELRLIDLGSSEEVDTDGLTVSRFERLSASDYHLGVLPSARAVTATPTPKGTLETLSGMGSGMWNVTISATNLLSSSAASVRSNGSKSDGDSSAKVPSISSSVRGKAKIQAAHPNIATPGMKIFIHSPYDCILATKRDLSDHLTWLLEQNQYQQAWKLIDEHPDVISSSPERLAEIGPGTPERKQEGSDDFYDDNTSIVESANRLIYSAVEKEKRRIGELWIQQLVQAGDWMAAGQVCGRVLGTSSRWEHWVWTFAGANKFDEITPYIPTTHLHPPLPSTIYEVVLGHYIRQNRPRLRELLDQWPPELFDIKTITTALENELKYRDVREDSVEDGEQGRDWRIVMESLGKLNAADGKPRDALKCYIRLHDADAAMALIKDFHLIDAIADDIPGLILLRVSKEQMRSAPIKELEEATSEAIALLVDEAQHGLLRPEVVVKQLQDKELPLYLFFYLRSLWRGDGLTLESEQNRERLVSDSKSLVDDLADLAIQLFASYDRPLLMEFLKTSTAYNFEKVRSLYQRCLVYAN